MPETPFDQLADLFRAMDAAWNKTAAEYEFQCAGCEDNCCLSLFYHHTHIENAYLWHGFETLSPQARAEILARAREYLTETFGPDDSATPDPTSRKIPCPLLLDGRCRLYAYRPMICRMHGLPHELHRPGGQVMKGPGCDAGTFNEKPYAPFDRTPYYREMAAIEMRFRATEGKTEKIRATIAHMLLDK